MLKSISEKQTRRRNKYEVQKVFIGCLSCSDMYFLSFRYSYYSFLYCSAASTNPLNNGWGLLGRDFSSGCACVAINHG